MEVFFSDIPEEGLPISGKLSPAFFDLQEGDSIKLSGDIEYDLVLYAFEEIIALTGTVSGPFELQCVTCLEYFPYQAEFGEWNSEFDIEADEIKFDPRESLRDEILLSLPTVPHCDEFIENRDCPKTSLLEKFEHDEMPFEVEASEEQTDDVWGALDQLDSSKQ